MRVPNGLAALGGLVGLAVLAGCVLVGCDAAPGPAPEAGRPPILLDFSYTPQDVVLEEWPPDQVVGNQVRIPLRLEVTARDPDGASVEVGYLVRSPLNPNASIAMGTLTPVGEDRFTGGETLSLPVGEVGGYTILVYALDGSGLPSNQVRGLLTYTSVGEPPVIEALDVPEEIQRPDEGEEPVVFRATVSDPDGLANIREVTMIPNGGDPIRLCDDGSEGLCSLDASSGDLVAGDGIYTVTVVVSSTNQLGENTFDFQAFDRSGLESEVVRRIVTIVE